MGDTIRDDLRTLAESVRTGISNDEAVTTLHLARETNTQLAGARHHAHPGAGKSAIQPARPAAARRAAALSTGRSGARACLDSDAHDCAGTGRCDRAAGAAGLAGPEALGEPLADLLDMAVETLDAHLERIREGDLTGGLPIDLDRLAELQDAIARAVGDYESSCGTADGSIWAKWSRWRPSSLPIFRCRPSSPSPRGPDPERPGYEKPRVSDPLRPSKAWDAPFAAAECSLIDTSVDRVLGALVIELRPIAGDRVVERYDRAVSGVSRAADRCGWWRGGRRIGRIRRWRVRLESNRPRSCQVDFAPDRIGGRAGFEGGFVAGSDLQQAVGAVRARR